jgi:sulfatase modifying factor 1
VKVKIYRFKKLVKLLSLGAIFIYCITGSLMAQTKLLGSFSPIHPGDFIKGTVGNYGDEYPLQVRISKWFEMMKTEVTQKMWKDVTGHKGISKFKGDTLPVERVTWWSAIAFANKVSEISGFTACYTLPVNCHEDYRHGNLVCYGNPGLPGSIAKVQDCNGYRLPTDAEWEYAARAGTTTPYSFGYDPRKLGSYAWTYENSDSRTHPVGLKGPNLNGLYDMHGNVSEWTYDWYHWDPSVGNDYSPVDPVGRASGDRRTMRGGSFLSSVIFNDLRSASRSNYKPLWGHAGVGFRLVRTLLK